MTSPTITHGLAPVEFTPPVAAPAWPLGLDTATTWTEAADGDALHWLPSGVQVRLRSYREPGAFGIWGAPWCVSPDDLDPEADIKTGPPVADDDPDPFEAQTVWAFDRLQECGNLSAFDRGQAVERARQTFALRGPIAVETEFATRLLADAPSPTDVDDLVAAVGHLEQTFAATGTAGLIHARVGLLARAEHLRLVVREPGTEPGSPGVLRTPAGHRWVFGAGYATPLGNTLIGTSPTYGWRDEVAVREVIQYEQNQFVTIAERSVIVAYEAVIGAAVIA